MKLFSSTDASPCGYNLKIPILLTSAVYVSAPLTNLTNTNARIDAVLISIMEWAKDSKVDKIVICDGSGFDFSKLTMPVLLMTGEFDKLAPPSEIKSVAQRICEQAKTPDVRFEIITGAGHVCNVEQPEQYNRVLSEFLARLPK